MLDAPSVGQHFEAVDATLWRGKQESLNREALTTIIAGMSLPNLLPRLQKEATVIVPADRLDLLPALIMAHRSATYGPLASLLLTGGFEIPETVATLLSDSEVDLPIGATNSDTFPTAIALREVSGVATSSPRKVELARALFDRHVDEEALLAAIELPRAEIRTPSMFEHQLMQMARRDLKRIVLPEGRDHRGERGGVVGEGLLLDELLPADLVLQLPDVLPDPLDDADRQRALRLRVEELVLHGRGAAVEQQDVTGHGYFPWGIGFGQGSGLQDDAGLSPSGPGWR